jgi:hypothetical protein
MRVEVSCENIAEIYSSRKISKQGVFIANKFNGGSIPGDEMISPKLHFKSFSLIGIPTVIFTWIFRKFSLLMVPNLKS